MFEFIKGKLVESSPSQAIVDLGGLGYRLLIPVSNYGKLPQIGGEVYFYLSCVIREDAHTLYGFLTRAERELFERFTGVSGIGPKTALALVGHMPLEDLHMALSREDINLLCKIPGIGKKTAERLIIEMRDKLKDVNLIKAMQDADPKEDRKLLSDAISALVNLGYHPVQAQKAVRSAKESFKTEPRLAELITSALQSL
jgi:Holliday junction DNA helicase RuvA